MKKYLYIYKTELMSNMAYVFNIASGFISYLIHIIIFFYLWNYMYDDPSQIINGYTKSEMIWYVIITEVLWISLGSRQFCKKINDDVKSGNITYNLNKPYSYISYLLSNKLGEVTMKIVFYSIGGILVGLLFLHTIPHLNILQVLLVVITIILATIINIFLIMFIGLCSFFIEDANPFHWMYSKLILIFGILFPIEYFPKVIAKVLNYSPVYVVSYGPARMFVNFSYVEAIKIIIAQIIYIMITYLLCLLIYKKGEKRLNVNGG